MKKTKVYAYRMQPLFVGPEMEWTNDERYLILRKPYAYLHMWVDDGLNYHEEQRDTPTTPEHLVFATHPHRGAEIYGPKDYTCWA